MMKNIASRASMKFRPQDFSDRQNNLSQRSRASDFFLKLQSGDLAFHNLIKHAIVVFGSTKNGKTTLCHFLTKIRLEGYKLSNGQTHFKRHDGNLNRNIDSQIGSTTNSTTIIPNQFTTNLQVQNDSVVLIDSPGYQDNKGIQHVLTNAYFYYRLFEKIQNMKLVLVFDENSFQSSSYYLIDEVFEQYFDAFKKFQSVKSQIFRATTFVLTKIKASLSLEDIENKIKAYKRSIPKNTKIPTKIKTLIQELIENVLNNKKLFIFRAAKCGEVITDNDNILEQINKKSQSFTRELSASNPETVDMQLIKFSKGNVISKLQIQPHQKRQCENILQELKHKCAHVIELFFKLSQKVSSWCILNTIQLLNTSFYRQKIQELQELVTGFLSFVSFDEGQKYKQKRVQYISNIQKKYRNSGFSNQVVGSKRFWTRYLSIAQSVIEFGQKYSNKSFKNIEELVSTKQDFFSILESIMRFCAQDSNSSDSSSKIVRILSQYIYCVNRLFEQIKVFNLIMQKPPEQSRIFSQVQNLDSRNSFTLSYFEVFDQVLKKISQIPTNLLEKMAQKDPSFKSTSPKDLLQFVVNQNPSILQESTGNEQLILQKIFNSSVSFTQSSFETKTTKIVCVLIKYRHAVKNFRMKQFLKEQHQETFKDKKIFIVTFLTLMEEIKRALYQVQPSNSGKRDELLEARKECWLCLAYLIHLIGNRNLAIKIYMFLGFEEFAENIFLKDLQKIKDKKPTLCSVSPSTSPAKNEKNERVISSKDIQNHILLTENYVEQTYFPNVLEYVQFLNSIAKYGNALQLLKQVRKQQTVINQQTKNLISKQIQVFTQKKIFHQQNMEGSLNVQVNEYSLKNQQNKIVEVPLEIRKQLTKILLEFKKTEGLLHKYKIVF